jgi:hypothetical protein
MWFCKISGLVVSTREEKKGWILIPYLFEISMGGFANFVE